MKIKTKKQLNLPQLIEWAMENDVRNKFYRTYDSEGNISEVYFNIMGLPQFSSMVDKSDIFTVEEEIEITEDTVIPGMLTIYDNGVTHISNNKSLSNLSKTYLKSVYIMNDDYTMTLFWTHEKGLVE